LLAHHVYKQHTSHDSDLFLMSECAFLFHIDTDSDPSRASDNTPSMSSSAISPLVRWILSLWSCNSTFVYTTSHGRNHGWNVEGDQGLGPNTRALAPRARQRPGWVLGARGSRPLTLWGSGGITRGNFL